MQNLKAKIFGNGDEPNGSAASPNVDLLPHETFRREVEREILRSDRSGSPLALLVFDLRASFGAESERAASLEVLAAAVCTCSRRSDTRGWYAEDGEMRVGLLLHDTKAQKATRLIQSVRHCLTNGKGSFWPEGWPVEISCEVFSYPPEQSIDKESDQNHNGNGHKRTQGTSYHGSDDHSWSPAEKDGASHEFSARRLNELIGHPLPWWKRGMDILGASLGLLALSPVLLSIAAGIKLTSRGPIFFKQERIGYLGRPFMFWKFRTMKHQYNPQEHAKHLEELIHSGDGQEKPMVKLDKKNSAITPLGRLLRISSMDELPQLINVLRGEMSLVGPRPCLRYEAEKYACWHSRRFDVVPGMTGLWQVNGKNRTTFREMIRLDIEYARHCSFRMDMEIVLRTFPTIWADIRQGLFPRETAEVKNVRQA